MEEADNEIIASLSDDDIKVKIASDSFGDRLSVTTNGHHFSSIKINKKIAIMIFKMMANYIEYKNNKTKRSTK